MFTKICMDSFNNNFNYTERRCINNYKKTFKNYCTIYSNRRQTLNMRKFNLFFIKIGRYPYTFTKNIIKFNIKFSNFLLLKVFKKASLVAWGYLPRAPSHVLR